MGAVLLLVSFVAAVLIEIAVKETHTSRHNATTTTTAATISSDNLGIMKCENVSADL